MNVTRNVNMMIRIFFNFRKDDPITYVRSKATSNYAVFSLEGVELDDVGDVLIEALLVSLCFRMKITAIELFCQEWHIENHQRITAL